MKRTIAKYLLVVAIAALPAVAGDNSLGTWRLDTAKAKYTPAPMPVKSYTMVREAAPDGVKVTVTGERTNGDAVSASYTAKFDGSESQVRGSGTPYSIVAVKRVDDNTFTYEAKNPSTKYHANFRLVVASDGKSAVVTGKGTDTNGKPMTLRFVLDKQ
jgi:hypothetical protein